jgi:K+-transporting ATPase KdpF subunit
MNVATLAAAIIAVLLLVYLFLSLIKPEWFE